MLDLLCLTALWLAPRVTATGRANTAANQSFSLWRPTDTQSQTTSGLSSLIPPRDPKCPPCFNCVLPAFSCGQYGECNPYDGQCKCPPGFGGQDCLTPLCGSLADGDQRYPRPDDNACQCKDGWGGINCNVCQTDQACKGFPLRGEAFNSLEEEAANNMTCYKAGLTVNTNYQMCDVTNRKILDMLPGRPPQVTFACDGHAETCNFQFWIGQKESFYCELDSCATELKHGYESNSTFATCSNIQCKCIPGRMMCGEEGSVDIGEFLTEEIKGPASFDCTTGKGCQFKEPAMNQLINDIFGDPYITLDCDSGECLHYTQVPGYVRPVKPDNSTMVAISAATAGLIFVLASAALWYMGRAHKTDGFGQIRLPADEAQRLMFDHIPAQLHFSDISYSLSSDSSNRILDGITGTVKNGQVMAIMGASGAGKSTFLDILARKAKRGKVTGEILVNGRPVADEEYTKIMGFVDQEDTLMSTLTVYETVLYSALLRLPRDMSYEAKKFRTLETMHELGILGIKDSRIGESGRRSISGGEKRRVSIACELVTSPSILFLDEPTSGLDAYNAFNVVESLVTLAHDYNRTVVFTIHQPRSNIVSLFDQLLVLAQGKTVYSGEYAKCNEYFDSIGYPCPPGFNIADYLIDLTMQTEESAGKPSAATPPEIIVSTPDENSADEERAFARTPSFTRKGNGTASHTQVPSEEDETELQIRSRPPVDNQLQPDNIIKRKASQLWDILSISASQTTARPLHPKLAAVIQSYASSDIAASIRSEITNISNSQQRPADTDNGNSDSTAVLPDVEGEIKVLRNRTRASWGTQFRILSGRAFKNLYRDPALLTAHYLSSIIIALLCGGLFRNVTNDISGFQNRLGLFFFTLALFGFSCLSSLGLFANERVLFMRERANGYYSSFTYFSSKVLFDIIPLRVVPPLVFGGIIYGLAGLVPTVAAFWKFLLTLVLFNLTTASAVLFISVAVANTSVASLIGTLVMLYNLLFAGLLINRDSTASAIGWLHTLSFFHAAYEALAVNELRYLQLKEIKYGVELDVPAATILSIFGFHAQAFWFPDIVILAVMFTVFTFSSYVYLHLYVKEKR
ncbi:hypothetical protein FRB95_012349 [Tulasnella sp. JGI-2019a]|nr:hypothetical protein FRB95_012349 [Tulasnella sp. JGI-2019a]